MKPERMRVRIAEYLGWRVVPSITQGGWLVQHNAQTMASFWFGSKEATLETAAGYLPDYPNCLNACAEMEAALDAAQLQYTYSHFLYNVVVPKSVQPFRASANDRCSAFCRTVGIWEDEPAEQSPTRISVPPVAGRNADRL